jgi:hypothetical protein
LIEAEHKIGILNGKFDDEIWLEKWLLKGQSSNFIKVAFVKKREILISKICCETLSCFKQTLNYFFNDFFISCLLAFDL